MNDLKLGIRITEEHDYGSKQIKIFRTEGLTPAGELAWQLLVEWGKFAFKEDGEDSQGRQKARQTSVKEVTERCFAAADLFIATARERGAIQAMPDLNEINTERDAKRAAKEAKEHA